MRATEEAAFWLYSAKDWIDGMNAFVPDRLKAYALSMACEMLLKYCIVTTEEALQKRTATYY